MKRFSTLKGLLGLPLIFPVFWFLSMEVSGQPTLTGLPFVRNFHSLTYKAGIQNWAIAQDRRGLLYVANNFGLLEYDGSQWQTYRVKNGTKVRSIAPDGRGRVFVGCQGDFGYFFPDEAGQLKYISLADSLPPQHRNFDEAWNVYLDLEKIYFCTFSKIYIYNQSTFTIVAPPQGVDRSHFVNRQLYINQLAHGLGILNGTAITLLSGGDFFKKTSISSILPLHGNYLLVATAQKGIFQFGDGTIRPWRESLQRYFRESIVNCMIRLRNGNFAVGTQNNGLLILSPEGELLLKLTNDRGIENRTILSLYEDDLSNLWVGQNNGLAYVELGSPFTIMNEQIGLPGTGYTAYLSEQKFYLGTNTGVYVKRQADGADFQLIENTQGQVYHIGEYGHDLLIGHHNGAMRIAGETSVRISPEPGSWTFLSLGDEPNKLIGGTYRGLQLYRLMNGHWTLSKKLHGFDESSRLIAQDPSGDIWVTHGYKGAYKIKLNPEQDSIERVSFYGANKGFPSNLLINIFRVRNELLFTSERGIYKYDPKTDTFIQDDFFSYHLGKDAQVAFIQEDVLGNIYFISHDHIGVLQKNYLGEYVLETDVFNKIRKYLNDDLINISVLRNNEVLFGAKNGFIRYDPKLSVKRKSIFKTLIRKVTTSANGGSTLFYGNYSKGDSIIERQLEHYRPKLDYESNTINFTFAATSYEGDADLLFQFYLENYEKRWTEWSEKTQKEYTNLKEGHYVFHVRAQNVNGEVSPETTYEFTINPPWYRSVWAYAFYAIYIIALLFIGFNFLDRRYKEKQKLMALRQEEQLNEKESELEKLSQETHEEITRLQHEKLQSELQHMNNELATATMHLLNKNEFIAGIKNNLNHLVKKGTFEDLKKELLQITKDIESNISHDPDWEHFQFHFDRVHGDFITRFKSAFPILSPQEVKLSAYLRMNLSTKEIAQLLNISVRGVEISRYRLRKKLQLDRNKNLQDFILNF